ncbi:BatA domain-containing protein [Gaetbulibacter saemankumensis]|uniref:BatA domain-containing protein n=1 Tax=Gaetbulibacter saemankumensis TaxID=311208 RepID=UPI00041604D2|nr:BatA domain-containing protein [Gaetbulibacter saemankumensis]
MQFKHPELLYALFLLLIPIIIHLFQLRKFKKVPFTNVAFLKKVTLQTRKSSQIKKWLILATRLFLLTAIILAFAQPFTSNYDSFKTKKETVIYLDNSYSMQAKGSHGELLKRAVQDLIKEVPQGENVSIFTNNETYKNTTIGRIANELIEINYSSTPLSLNNAYLKSQRLFSTNRDVLKQLVFISDFQNTKEDFNITPDSLTQVHLVKLTPQNRNNVSIDSAYISEKNAANTTLTVLLNNNGTTIDNLPISLYNNDTLIAKTSVSIKESAETSFTLPSNQIINGKISINDNQLQFDNTLFFNINAPDKIKVLSINETDDAFLKRLYSENEFNYISSKIKELDYNLISQQHLIVLNELETIPVALIAALKSFIQDGGTLIMIPSEKGNKESYNVLTQGFGVSFGNLITTGKNITSINYSHPLYRNGVFEKQVNNFQYPKVNSYYNVQNSHASAVLSFEDNKAFISASNGVYIFSAPINSDNSNFKNSPLIVPTFYNMGRYSLKSPELYYTIGNENNYAIETSLQPDNILSLENGDIHIIPRQRYYNNKVLINTSDNPESAGVYSIKNKDTTLKNVSYNYNRDESILSYLNLSDAKQITVSNSVSESFEAIKSDTKINALWKWFVIFALALLITEMLILKYFK